MIWVLNVPVPDDCFPFTLRYFLVLSLRVIKNVLIANIIVVRVHSTFIPNLHVHKMNTALKLTSKLVTERISTYSKYRLEEVSNERLGA